MAHFLPICHYDVVVPWPADHLLVAVEDLQGLPGILLLGIHPLHLLLEVLWFVKGWSVPEVGSPWWE